MTRTIATINFKGGVGKTTTTWALGHVAALQPKMNSLVFDLDAQMSLTQAVALNEDGSPFKDFSRWYDRSIMKKKTIFDASPGSTPRQCGECKNRLVT